MFYHITLLISHYRGNKVFASLRKIYILPETGVRARSIEVVTQSQFALLEAAVKELEAKGAPPPPPKMPDNEKLKEDIVKGSASLTDTMHAMNVSWLLRF